MWFVWHRQVTVVKRPVRRKHFAWLLSVPYKSESLTPSKQKQGKGLLEQELGGAFNSHWPPRAQLSQRPLQNKTGPSTAAAAAAAVHSVWKTFFLFCLVVVRRHYSHSPRHSAYYCSVEKRLSPRRYELSGMLHTWIFPKWCQVW